MRRRAAAIAIAAAAGVFGGCSDDPQPTPPPPRALDGLTPEPDRPEPARGGTPAPPGAPLAARVLRRTTLRDAPAGRVVARIGRRTEFRSPRIMAVVRRRDGWVGVHAAELPNGRTGWVRQRDVDMLWSRRTIEIDLSERELVVRHRGRVESRHRVDVGKPETPTPTGRFAVTDRLTPDAGSPYGCCILALNGHQPKLPQGWGGGDRLAIHGTPAGGGTGAMASNGCLRADRSTMRSLMRRIALATPVTIRR